jgi:hypothetical protein
MAYKDGKLSKGSGLTKGWTPEAKAEKAGYPPSSPLYKYFLQGLNEAEEHCKTCGGEGVVYWDYDDPEVGTTVKATAPCPACSVTEAKKPVKLTKREKDAIADCKRHGVPLPSWLHDKVKSLEEDADNKEADQYRNWGLKGKFIYSGWG